MSDFFDDLGKAARRVASNVGTEFSVAVQEQKVKEAYQTLGRLYYKAAQEGTEIQGGEFDTQVVKIRDLLAQIEELRRNQNVTE